MRRRTPAGSGPPDSGIVAMPGPADSGTYRPGERRRIRPDRLWHDQAGGHRRTRPDRHRHAQADGHHRTRPHHHRHAQAR
ncbi:hypothetical protein [Streptomyces violaceus]|uniref:hypothetical protein n=1 Tax=Streptomyces violaceus TaxID=1936 RepID=UPI00187647B4|nr:hypothetical protein [Streptomyces janthinus]